MIAQLTRDKAGFQDELINLQEKENLVTQELLRLDQKKPTLRRPILTGCTGGLLSIRIRGQGWLCLMKAIGL